MGGKHNENDCQHISRRISKRLELLPESIHGEADSTGTRMHTEVRRDSSMQKSGVKTRDIRFFSEKNDTMICVHTPLARDYAKWLEDQPWVERYETGVLLDASQMDHVSRVDIRSNYFETVWESDFMLIHADGRKEIREIISAEQLRKRAIVEQLELSRRYWSALDVSGWKVVVME